MILHTLNALPAAPAFRDCLRIVQSGDALVLLGDGVYAAIPDSAGYNAVQASNARLYILTSDAACAGIRTYGADIQGIDMHALVELTEEYPRHQAWY